MKALKLPDENQIYAILVDRLGRVVWRAQGDLDDSKAAGLERVLTNGNL